VNKKQREALTALRDVMLEHDIKLTANVYSHASSPRIEVFSGHDELISSEYEIDHEDLTIILDRETE
jgi:hypothetical protein